MESDIERLKVLIEDNPRLTTRELSTMLACNQSTIDRHLHEMEKVNKLGTWVPHQLTSDNIQQRISICHFLLSKPNRHRSLQQIITGDEKWVLYVDHKHKRQWINPEDLPEPEPKNDLHPKKLCCQFGGISKVLSTMNFYVLISQSTLSFTANNFKI